MLQFRRLLRCVRIPNGSTEISRFLSVCPTNSSFTYESSPASPPLDFPLLDYSQEEYEKPIIKRVLLIEKLTRYEQYLYSQHVSEHLIQEEVKVRFPGMWKTYQSHRAAVDRIVSTLTNEYGIETKVRKAFHVTAEDTENVDAVIAAGGDGTFLGAASILLKPLPLFGINTDPARSEGRLLLNHFEGEDMADVVNRIIEGDYIPITRQRVKVTIDDEVLGRRVIPHRPLNDVMVAELEAAPTLYAELKIDDSIPERQKSSGVLVCTGTGSTAWNYNMSKVREDVIEKVLTAFISQQSPEVLNMLEYIPQRDLRDEANKKLVFDPRCKVLRFTVREPIENRVFTVKRASGFAKQISVRPLSSANTFVFLDGISQVSLPASSTVIFDISEGEPLFTALPKDRSTGQGFLEVAQRRLTACAATEESRDAVRALGEDRRKSRECVGRGGNEEWVDQEEIAEQMNKVND